MLPRAKNPTCKMNNKYNDFVNNDFLQTLSKKDRQTALQRTNTGPMNTKS